MSEQQKTISFIGVAAVALVSAIVTYFQTQPTALTGFENVGTEFFADFTGSDQAAALEVSAVDADAATLKEFRVQEKDGVWRIPSHFGYPAEAAERLAETASSLIGLTREALVSRLEVDHERFGVVDPRGSDVLDPSSAGKRITIRDQQEEILVDLIVGNQVEENDQLSPGSADDDKPVTSYYVRHPDEKQTYKVSLNLELSTRFSDWIKPDLLELDSADVRRINVDNYALIEQGRQVFKEQGEQLNFTRDAGFGPWSMEGLDTETKELDSAKIDDALRTLDDLKIVGVRKKMDYNGQQVLTADLKFAEIEGLNNDEKSSLIQQVRQELAVYGFTLAQDPNSGSVICVSSAGEIAIGRENGVVYTMQFGKPARGSDEEIEIGTTTNNEKADKDTDQVNDNDEDSDEANTDNAENRYAMIRVAFDQSLLEDQPVQPVAPIEPVKPEGYVAATADKTEAENTEVDEAPTPNSEEDTEATEDTDQRPQAFQEYDEALAQYEQDKTEYELKKTQFEDDQKRFADRIDAGKSLVEELNERFGQWFYVIAGDNLQSIQLNSEGLVSEKTQEKEGGAAANGNTELPPGLGLGNSIPGLSNPALEKAAAEAKAADTESTQPADSEEGESSDSDDDSKDLPKEAEQSATSETDQQAPEKSTDTTADESSTDKETADEDAADKDAKVDEGNAEESKSEEDEKQSEDNS